MAGKPVQQGCILDKRRELAESLLQVHDIIGEGVHRNVPALTQLKKKLIGIFF